MNTVTIKESKEKLLKLKHPFCFKSSIKKESAGIKGGDIVRVDDSRGKFIAYGYYNKESQITVRLLEWDESKEINESWWKTKIMASVKRRDHLLKNTNALRMINAESDFLPGLIADKYDEFLVIQILTMGIESRKELIVEVLYDALKPSCIYERSDTNSRRLEGLSLRKGGLKGFEPPSYIKIEENGSVFLVDIKCGQKTGFFLDQRLNRLITAEYAKEKTVLDCFSHTGSFAISALKNNAKSVIAADSSRSALEVLKENYKLNGLSYRDEDIICADVFELLRKFREEKIFFDMIILDPPKLAPTKIHSEKAIRAYKDLNMIAMQILNPEGILATFSCSGSVNLELFKKVIAFSGIDANKHVQVLHTLTQPEDHPVRLSFPESEYLKGLICRVI